MDLLQGERWGCSPQTPTRAVTALDLQERMLLDRSDKQGSRCCLEEPMKPSLLALRFWPDGKAANPDAKHPGKARENLRGKVHFPLKIFLAFLGQKPSIFR